MDFAVPLSENFLVINHLGKSFEMIAQLEALTNNKKYNTSVYAAATAARSPSLEVLIFDEMANIGVFTKVTY